MYKYKLRRETLEARLLSKRRIDENGCWIWTGRLTDRGYGSICDPTRPGQTRTTVHRVAAIFWLNFDPASGFEVCHHCDNPPCFNPEHLFVGTHAENMRDMALKGRACPPVGQAHPLHVLTERDVQAIRCLRAEGVILRELSDQFGVSMALVSKIARREVWKHVA